MSVTSRSYAAGGAVRVAGRLLLWACIALVLVRGLGAIASSSPHAATRRVAASTRTVFPNAEADAFAVRFSDAFLTFSPGQDAAYQRTVGVFLAHGLSDQTALPSHGPGVSVAQAMVAREVSLGDARALLTVAALLSNGQVRYLAVPVAQDTHGGFDVFALPALVAPPAAGTAPAVSTTPVPIADAAEVGNLTHGFLATYLSGEQGSALAGWLAPGTVLAAMPPGLTLQSLGSVGLIGRSAGRLTVQAEAQVRDSASGATYQLAYRLTLARRQSGWRVAAVAGGPQS